MDTGRDRLKAWIERSKLDQVGAARVIGMHPTQLNHILTGKRRPGLDTAVKIEQATGIVVEAWVPFASDESAETDREPANSWPIDKA